MLWLLFSSYSWLYLFVQFPSGVGVFKKLSGPNDSGGVWGRMGGSKSKENGNLLTERIEIFTPIPIITNE